MDLHGLGKLNSQSQGKLFTLMDTLLKEMDMGLVAIYKPEKFIGFQESKRTDKTDTGLEMEKS